ncbi:MAG TPA: ABC transporter permease [Rugosimonospora sp.]
MRALAHRFRLAIATPAGGAGFGICLFIGLLAVFGPLLAPHDPDAVQLSQRLAPPSPAHWFGTDDLGRDLFSRVLAGAPRTVLAAGAVVAVSVVVGLLVGVLAGFLGGLVDQVLMRITDIFVGYPALLLAVAITAALGTGLVQATIALAVVWWAGYARLMRGQAAAVRGLPFVEAARTTGASRWAIMTRHVLPNVAGPLLVKATVDLALVVESIAALGFIGLGAQPPTPEWGLMIAQSRQYAIEAWWYPTLPGLSLLLIVVGCNLFGDALARAFATNPRSVVSGWRRPRRSAATPLRSSGGQA